MTIVLRRLGAVGALVLISACSHLQAMTSLPTTPPLGTSARDHVRVAVDLLGQGERNRAKTELEAALRAHPGDAVATRLMQEINADPRVLLGARNHAYVVRNGETMAALADRFLGDPLLFYALARYNNIDAPNTLSSGQTILIPGRGSSVASASIAPPLSAPALRGIPRAVAPPSADPLRASQLRLAGLEQLNRGAVERAVALLRQAQGLDQSSEPIRRDLDRALRIQASLQNHASE